MSYNFSNNYDGIGCLGAIGVLFLSMVIAAGLGLLFAFPEMWLWNWLVPKLFNGPVVTYWEMVGLHVLAAMLVPKGTTSSTKSN